MTTAESRSKRSFVSLVLWTREARTRTRSTHPRALVSFFAFSCPRYQARRSLCAPCVERRTEATSASPPELVVVVVVVSSPPPSLARVVRTAAPVPRSSRCCLASRVLAAVAVDRWNDIFPLLLFELGLAGLSRGLRSPSTAGSDAPIDRSRVCARIFSV